MKVTIDRLGRLVLPKQIRDQLGFGSGTELEVFVEGRGVRLEPVARNERRLEVVDGWPVLSQVPGMVITDEQVRQLRDSSQR